MNTKKIIKPAAQVRAETAKNKDFDAACVRVMADIENAKAEGRYHTLFNPRPNHMSGDIKAAFQREGYEFRPVAMQGDVMQRDLFICW